MTFSSHPSPATAPVSVWAGSRKNSRLTPRESGSYVRSCRYFRQDRAYDRCHELDRDACRRPFRHGPLQRAQRGSTGEGIDGDPMRSPDSHRWGWFARWLGMLGLIALSPSGVAAQAPVIIPGLPGAGLHPVPGWRRMTGLMRTCPAAKPGPRPTQPTNRLPLRRTGSPEIGSGRATPCSTMGLIFAPTFLSSTRG